MLKTCLHLVSGLNIIMVNFNFSFLYRILKNIIEEGESLETISVGGNVNVSQEVFKAVVNYIKHEFSKKNSELGINRNSIDLIFENGIH